MHRRRDCLGWRAVASGTFAALATFSGQVSAQAQPAATPQQGATTNREGELQERVDQLEQRVNELESTTVLSEPETRVKRIEVYVDENGVEYLTPQPGTQPVVTYQRERVYRRQTISEKIEEALDDAASTSVAVGVDAAIVMQHVQQADGEEQPADSETYELRLRRSVLHRRARAVHDLLRRHRRSERHAARQRGRWPHAVERLCRAAR